MGSNNGTGQPYWFRCSQCRVHGSRLVGGWAADVTLTGGKRPHRGKAGQRNSFIDREYTCGSCGHKGWSCHIDLAFKAGDHRYLQIKDGVESMPTWVKKEDDDG